MSEQAISVEVENWGDGGDGAGRAGMAIVRLNGTVVARLATQEGIEFFIGGPSITTSSHHPDPTEYGSSGASNPTQGEEG